MMPLDDLSKIGRALVPKGDRGQGDLCFWAFACPTPRLVSEVYNDGSDEEIYPKPVLVHPTEYLYSSCRISLVNLTVAFNAFSSF